MIEVIKIERKGNRIKIFFSQSDPILLSIDTYNKFQLSLNQKLSENYLEDIIAYEELNQAKQSALRFLAIRNHSIFELRRKLSQKKFAPETVNKTLESLIHSQLIDDEKFAKEFADELTKRKYFGPSRIKTELRKRGISDSQVKSLLTDISDETEMKNLETTAEKYLKRFSTKLTPSDKQKVINYLFQKGFSWEKIKIFIDKID
ncbi:MAG: regulatory protein RecX [Ignavibacteria bacterium]|nr:regulatory protein RecX [Ignavibacteria bacterium]